jgi:two-component system, NarL family, invasion response regulator UvrY
MKKFLLIDDHEVVRSGIHGLLSEIYKPCEVIEASNTEMATEKLKQNTFDLVMMDIQMPNSDSLGMMEYIHIRYPDARVLIFSMSSENIYAKRFLKAGAKGFLSKDSSLDEIKKAINLVLNNRRYVSDSLAESLAFSSVSNTPENPFEKLSQREFEIASLLLSGQTVSEVSKSLNLQTSTVGTHKSRIFEKLGIDNILELKELATSYNL